MLFMNSKNKLGALQTPNWTTQGAKAPWLVWIVHKSSESGCIRMLLWPIWMSNAEKNHLSASLIIISELGIPDSLVNMLPTGSDNSGGSSSGPGGSSSGPGGSVPEPPKPSGSGLPQSTSNNSITSDVSYTDDDIITTHDLRMRNINILIDNNNKLTEDEKKCLKTLYTEMAEESKKAKQELSRFKNSGNLPMIFKK